MTVKFVNSLNFYKDDPETSKLLYAVLNEPIEKISLQENRNDKMNSATSLNSFTKKSSKSSRNLTLKYPAYDDQSKEVYNHFINKNMDLEKNHKLQNNELIMLPYAYHDTINEKDNLGFIGIHKIDQFLNKVCEYLDSKNIDYTKASIFATKHFSVNSIQVYYYSQELQIRLSYME